MSNQSCILCKTGYYLDGNNKCFSTNQLINCNSFGAYGCLGCTTGYFYTTNNYCTAISGCDLAKISGICLSCKNQYIFDSNNLYCCSSDNCLSCPS